MVGPGRAGRRRRRRGPALSGGLLPGARLGSRSLTGLALGLGSSSL